MTKIAFFTLISLCSFGAICTEWQHENPNFDRTGQVTIKSLAGVTNQLVNTGQQGLQSSASPTVLNIVSGSSKPLFGLRRGTVYQVYIEGLGLIDVDGAKLSSKYTFTEVAPLVKHSLVDVYYRSLSDVYFECLQPIADRYSEITVRTAHICQNGYMSANFDVIAYGLTLFKVAGLHQNGWCDSYYHGIYRRWDVFSGDGSKGLASSWYAGLSP
jgi:hypothetical protein